MNKYLARFGGGLGDVFCNLYQNSQYQFLPLISDDCIIDCIVTCCNPASKSIIDSLLSVNNNPVFRDTIYRDLFWENCDDYKIMFNRYIDDGYTFIGHKDSFDSDYGYFKNGIYDHKYKLTYQEQEYFDNIKCNNYVVIHPSGGLQTIDGLSREEYKILINLLLNEFPEHFIITIGASHNRQWTEIDCRNNVIFESDFNIQHSRFIDLTNKTSGALCANIVRNASAFIGSHSVWMNIFCHFDKPTVCILSNKTDWGDAENYIKTNGCRWCFQLPHVSVVPVIYSIKDTYNSVMNKLGDML